MIDFLDWYKIQGSRHSTRIFFPSVYHLIRTLWMIFDKSTTNVLAEKLCRCYSMNHIDEWNSFQSTSSLPCSPHTNTEQAQYPHVACRLLSEVTDESTHWCVKYGGNSQSASPSWRGCSPLSFGDAAAGSIEKVTLLFPIVGKPFRISEQECCSGGKVDEPASA